MFNNNKTMNQKLMKPYIDITIVRRNLQYPPKVRLDTPYILEALLTRVQPRKSLHKYTKALV